ncbi:MAG: hypothetical protein JW832_06510 [Deltaproteobacteria bacterium]|nr:hypothetical protein [Deltaproteobacteria bacterium]
MTAAKNAQQTTQSALHPTLFIGLGGSGCKTVTALREIIESSDKNKVFKQMVSFLKIDSRINPDPGVLIRGKDYLGMATNNLGSQMVDDLWNHGNTAIQEQFRKWWTIKQDGQPVKPTMRFLEGAGQKRENGRLVFAYHEGSQNVGSQNKIKARLQTIAASFDKSTHDWNTECNIHGFNFDKNAAIVIIAGLGGGTGSAIALDMAMLVRSIFPSANIVLYGFLHDVVSTTARQLSSATKTLMHQNTLHAVAEIEYWQQPARAKGNREPYCMYWNEIAPTPTEYTDTAPPLDTVFLIGAEMDGGAKFQEAETYYQSVAEFLGRFYGGDEANRYLSENINDINASIEPAELQDDRESLRYGRIGMHRVVLPIAEAERYLAFNSIAESLERGFLHRHSENKKPVLAEGKQKRDESGLPVYTGDIENELSKTLTETGLDRWQQMVLIEYQDGKNRKVLEKPISIDDKRINEAGTYTDFVQQVSSKVSVMSKAYSALQSGAKVADQATLLRKAVEERLESFCSWQSRRRISIQSMRFYLTSLSGICTVALEEAEKQEVKALEEINSKEQPASVCSDAWLKLQEPLFKKGLLGMLKKKENLGLGAKSAAISWLKAMSLNRYNYSAHRARKEWLQQCVSILQEWSRSLDSINPVYESIQKECAEQMARAEEDLRNRPGVQTNVLDSIDRLKRFKPEWFVDYKHDEKVKDEIYDLYRRGISGQVEDVPGFENKNGKGLWTYLSQIRLQRSTLSGADAEREVQRLVETCKRELQGIMTDMARFYWAQKIGSVSIWDALLWKIMAEQQINVSKPRGVGSLKEALLREVVVYEKNLRMFSNKERVAKERTGALEKSTIAYHRESAKKALVDLFGVGSEAFNPDIFLSELFPSWSTITTDEKDQIVLLKIESGYAARVFNGLEELPSYFQDPEGRFPGGCWSDRRYPKWFTDAMSPVPPAAKWARIGLAWCWGSAIGFTDESKKSNYKFSFGPETFESIYGLLDNLPVSSVWQDVLNAMQKHWNTIPPANRAQHFEAAKKFIAARRKDMRNTAKEPARLECLKAIEKVLHREATIAEEAGRNYAVCQDVARFFVDSAREFVANDPRNKK